jgi:hypothetical protein
MYAVDILDLICDALAITFKETFQVFETISSFKRKASDIDVSNRL